jgi:hypothetical protein
MFFHPPVADHRRSYAFFTVLRCQNAEPAATASPGGPSLGKGSCEPAWAGGHLFDF